MSTSDTTVVKPPIGFGAKIRQVGPGLLAAAAGVGAGDLVATMVAGARFGTVLLWAAVLGAVLKLALAEGVGRWHLASGSTLLDGWRRLGRWATVFFGVYIVIWGFVYGATAMSAVGLPLNALFGGLVGAVLGDDRRRRRARAGVGAALRGLREVHHRAGADQVRLGGLGRGARRRPTSATLSSGLVPRLPEGSVIYVLGLIGGVGGTITMAAYGYWMIAKGWKGTGWLSMMRLDNAVGYMMTGDLRDRHAHRRRRDAGRPGPHRERPGPAHARRRARRAGTATGPGSCSSSGSWR